MVNAQNFFEVSSNRQLDPLEVQLLRESVGWDPDTVDAWMDAQEKALAVRSVRLAETLIGVGFLLGTQRHAVVADVCVNPDYQDRGIGHSIVASLVEAAQSSRYVTLTFNEASFDFPVFYGRHEFVPISNAMQLRDANHQI